MTHQAGCYRTHQGRVTGLTQCSASSAWECQHLEELRCQDATSCCQHMASSDLQVWRRRAGFAAEDVLRAGDFFGICGFASVDWLSCELACQYLGTPRACKH